MISPPPDIEKEIKPCTFNSNVVCDCKDGYYDSNPNSHIRNCQTCKSTRFGGRWRHLDYQQDPLIQHDKNTLKGRPYHVSEYSHSPSYFLFQCLLIMRTTKGSAKTKTKTCLDFFVREWEATQNCMEKSICVL